MRGGIYSSSPALPLGVSSGLTLSFRTPQDQRAGPGRGSQPALVTMLAGTACVLCPQEKDISHCSCHPPSSFSHQCRQVWAVGQGTGLCCLRARCWPRGFVTMGTTAPGDTVSGSPGAPPAMLASRAPSQE